MFLSLDPTVPVKAPVPVPPELLALGLCKESAKTAISISMSHYY